MIGILVDINISLVTRVLRGVRGQSAVVGARYSFEKWIRHIDPDHNTEQLPGLKVSQEQHGVGDDGQGHEHLVELVLDQVPGTL